MDTEYFVDKDSVVRQIWGKGETILVIFAGASAEFALNKAVDWLYFTGRLPADPLGRLFSTVSYSRTILFSEKEAAICSINAIAGIHSAVEQQRGKSIPDWAYRDVLFLLIDYSIRSFEVMERKLTLSEKEEVFNVFHNVGIHMGLKGLPDTFSQWEKMRYEHIRTNLQHSHYTDDLFVQYRKHLGDVRYRILIESQIMVMPKEVRELLKFRKLSFLHPLIGLYKLSRKINADKLLKALVLPSKYKTEINDMDRI
jgi:hypothetical protein